MHLFQGYAYLEPAWLPDSSLQHIQKCTLRVFGILVSIHQLFMGGLPLGRFEPTLSYKPPDCMQNLHGFCEHALTQWKNIKRDTCNMPKQTKVMRQENMQKKRGTDEGEGAWEVVGHATCSWSPPSTLRKLPDNIDYSVREMPHFTRPTNQMLVFVLRKNISWNFFVLDIFKLKITFTNNAFLPSPFRLSNLCTWRRRT